MGGYDDDACEVCEGCGKVIAPGDKAHHGSEVWLCEDCAPDYEDLQQNPGSFMDPEGEPLTQAEADEQVATHLAAGGALSDKIVTPFEEA